MDQKTILLVEDDFNVIELLQDCLNSTNVSTISAANGEEALKMIKLTNIDLLITDLKMPKMSGDQLITNVRQFNTDLPIIVFSGYKTEFKDDKTIFIEKPLNEIKFKKEVLNQLKISG